MAGNASDGRDNERALDVCANRASMIFKAVSQVLLNTVCS
jgi:hypothetical protein